MRGQRIAKGQVGRVATVPLALDAKGVEVVIPKPVSFDGAVRDYPKGIKVGLPVKVETASGEVMEFVPTRWRGLAQVVDIDGERYKVRRWRETKSAVEIATHEAGLEKLAELAQARADVINNEQAAADGDVTTTVGDLLQRALGTPSVTRLAAGTQQDYGYAVPLVLTYPLANMLPRNVDVPAAKEFVREYTAKHGTGGARHAKAMVNRAMNLAIDDRRFHTPFNPFNLIGGDSPGTTIVRETGLDHQRSLTTLDAYTFLEALRNDPEAGVMRGPRKAAAGVPHINGTDIADLTVFLFATGCRIGEACAVRWSDVNFERMEIDVNATAVDLKGQGTIRQERTRDKPGTKTWTSDRYVAIADGTGVSKINLAAVLRARADAFDVDLGHPPATPVFGGRQNPDRYRDLGNLGKAIRKLYSRHGVGWGRSHIGRKWRVTSLFEAGVDAGKVRDLVGHKSIATTQLYLGKGRHNDSDVRAAL